MGALGAAHLSSDDSGRQNVAIASQLRCAGAYSGGNEMRAAAR